MENRTILEQITKMQQCLATMIPYRNEMLLNYSVPLTYFLTILNSTYFQPIHVLEMYCFVTRSYILLVLSYHRSLPWFWWCERLKKTHKKPKAEWEALKENNSVVLAKPWKHILLRRGKHTVIHITGKWVQLYRFLFSKKNHKVYFWNFQ